MPNIFDVAGYILRTVGGEISTVTLQKLCYYAQAWHLAYEGKPLFGEDFVRWDNGPVCKELFAIHRGRFCIGEQSIKQEFYSGEELSFGQLEVIDMIMDKYGKFDSEVLSKLTHEESPWLETKKNEVIDKDLMRDYYFDKWGADDDEDDFIPANVLTREQADRIVEETLNDPTIPVFKGADEAIKYLGNKSWK
jgi:uncharacterized phage-associated protein